MRVKVEVVVGKKDQTWYTETVAMIEPHESEITKWALTHVENRLRAEKVAEDVAFLAVWHVERLDAEEQNGRGEGTDGKSDS